jgi:hypothetical protein
MTAQRIGQSTRRALLGGDTENVAQQRIKIAHLIGRLAMGPHLRETAFTQYWPFPANPRCRAANRKDREFVVGLFGSPNRIRTDSLLVNRANLSYFAPLRAEAIKDAPAPLNPPFQAEF